ncbi:MAG: pyridoxamine 5'-phosphate oxidase family protein [Rhodocyclaceae bacterium]|jgi:predicted pyridoxine 5'-phosphate oxidase superfamily flavin-nucleotide-binding protein|nr:pyridoxamine 5'-phosphate oxidase family protein [Rhodocyclaceae bacterium]
MPPLLTDDVLDYIQRSVLCWLATADADGVPNVSPKEVFCAFGRDRVLVAHIASPGSVRNILANPNVCLSFVEVFVQKGYKLRGVAEIVTPTAQRYAEWLAPLTQITQGAFPIPGIIAITVTAVEPIMAPSYRLIPGTTEASQVASALNTYGVIAKPTDA